MQNIQEYDHYRRGVNLAIQYLSYKKRTEREVIQYLEKTIFKVMLFKMSLTIAIRKKFIDHEDYAESLKHHDTHYR